MPVFIPPDLEMNINGVHKINLVPMGRTTVVNASGNAIFNITNDNTPSGAPLLNNIVCFQLRGTELDSAFSTGAYTLSADKKTVSVPVKRTGAAVTLLGIQVLGAPIPAVGSTIEAFIVGEPYSP